MAAHTLPHRCGKSVAFLAGAKPLAARVPTKAQISQGKYRKGLDFFKVSVIIISLSVQGNKCIAESAGHSYGEVA